MILTRLLAGRRRRAEEEGREREREGGRKGEGGEEGEKKWGENQVFLVQSQVGTHSKAFNYSV